MGTAERREAPGGAENRGVTGRSGPGAPDRDVPAGGDGDGRRPRQREHPARPEPQEQQEQEQEQEQRERPPAYRPLWTEEPARRRRLPDPVRTAAVRAVLVVAVTLIQAMVAFLCTMAGSWLAFPMVLSSVASTVAATWGVLDVWVTRQVWNQRHGVVSVPSSTARAIRRERRRARRRARAAERAQERIRRRGGTGRLSHP
ncbi:hypothetical protein [Streptomyces sp. TP-A0875]|uniref:hypothetical protein n=1 Tax=Streptomyces sp. TP-A0875 TaxID=552354 RepID=UPI0006B5CC7A